MFILLSFGNSSFSKVAISISCQFWYYLLFPSRWPTAKSIAPPSPHLPTCAWKSSPSATTPSPTRVCYSTPSAPFPSTASLTSCNTYCTTSTCPTSAPSCNCSNNATPSPYCSTHSATTPSWNASENGGAAKKNDAAPDVSQMFLIIMPCHQFSLVHHNNWAFILSSKCFANFHMSLQKVNARLLF